MPLESISDRLISGRDLTKSFRNGGVRIDVLQGINADLDIGETVAIVGPSGIGKSTLLHILGTLDRPDDGTLLFQGENVFGYDDAKLAAFRNKAIGFVFQFHHLLPEFSALENAMMPALIADKWFKQTEGKQSR
jgi:lipoprotein-releasing system ATP-binding protein